MRKVLSAFLVASVLLLCAAPFSFAVDSFHSALSRPVNTDTKWYYPIVSNDQEQGILICVESEALKYRIGGLGLQLLNTTKPSFNIRVSQVNNYQITLTYYDLRTGIVLTSEVGTINITSTTRAFTWSAATILDLSLYLTFPAIYYQFAGDTNTSYSQLDSSYFRTDGSTSFIVWDSLGGGGSSTPDPVDPTSVVRSLIPRPYGDATTLYIADHLYLFAIYVGVPHQYEEQGYIQTTLDPAKYSGDNYNLYDITCSASGSSLNFVLKNRAQFSYNVVISQYDVVDGSFVGNSIRAITVASDFDNPSVNNFSISLSDPASYGIYQSGFFSRSHAINYPELRISWSDTIDYSLDLFVIKEGIVSIVQGITSTNSALVTANSTLSTISSTSSSILSQLQAFYTLMNSNWNWFKTTFYNNLNNQWNITNQYLLSIYNLLNETEETMTIEDDTSGVAAMESAKNDLVVTNASGQAVDAGDAAAAGLSQAAQQIGEIAQPVSTINQLMQNIVFDKPKLLLPIIVALGLGLMVTILGKNKSD